MAQTDIYLLRDRPDHIDAVIGLGDRFKRQLGLFPREALETAARTGHVLVACQSSNLVGYLLFRVSRKHPCRATIIHLCVEPECRGQGIGRRLVEDLKDRTRDLDGIRLSCRRDDEANRLWPQLGFQLLNEKPGRSKRGLPLNIWWFAQGSPLLSHISRTIAETNVVVAMDANVVFDFGSDDQAALESRALDSDWLQAQVYLCVTPELNNEIGRREDSAARKASRRLVGRFPVLEVDSSKFEPARSALVDILGSPSTESDASDIRQIAWAVAGSAEYFITRDDRLLRNSKDIEEKLDISIARPSEFITDFDTVVNDSTYQPCRFESSLLSLRAATPRNEESLVRAYLDFSSSEKKAPLVHTLRTAFADDPGSVQAAPLAGKNYRLGHPMLSHTDPSPLGRSLVRHPTRGTRAIRAST